MQSKREGDECVGDVGVMSGDAVWYGGGGGGFTIVIGLVVAALKLAMGAEVPRGPESSCIVTEEVS